MAYTGINFNRARMPARQGIIDPSRMGPPQIGVDGGSMRQGIVSAPTMREALMQTQPQQGVAEILSQGLPEMMPDLGGATSAASRQRQIADMLLQGAQSQDNTSIAGGLSQLGQAFLARKAGQKADTAETEREQITRDLLARATGGGPDAAQARAQLEGGDVASALTRYDAQQAAAQAAQQEQARLTALQNTPGITDQQRALLGLGIGEDEAGKMAFAPAPEPAKFASAADATGVRKYTEGPNIGQPVPGFETPRSERGGMSVSVDENGNPVVTFGGPGVGSSFGSRGDAVGATAFGTALESAGTADTTLALANQAKAIIDGGFNSGVFAPIKGAIGQVAGEFGLGDKGATADFEQFQAINNQLAAQMLKLFGGSDTERELAISISSNIGPKFSEETNKRMLTALENTVATQRQKPEFIAQWTRRHGSLDAINPETGLGFQGTWDRYLQEQAGMYSNAASDTAQVGMEGAAQGLLPADKMSRLEELRRKRDAGSIR
jgi:hypothetical protein